MYNPEYPGVADEDKHRWHYEGYDKECCLRRVAVHVGDDGTRTQFRIIVKLAWNTNALIMLLVNIDGKQNV